MINLTKTIDEIMRARLNINKWPSSIIILQKKGNLLMTEGLKSNLERLTPFCEPISSCHRRVADFAAEAVVGKEQVNRV